MLIETQWYTKNVKLRNCCAPSAPPPFVEHFSVISEISCNCRNCNFPHTSDVSKGIQPKIGIRLLLLMHNPKIFFYIILTIVNLTIAAKFYYIIKQLLRKTFPIYHEMASTIKSQNICLNKGLF